MRVIWCGNVLFCVIFVEDGLVSIYEGAAQIETVKSIYYVSFTADSLQFTENVYARASINHSSILHSCSV